ncbi:MAG: GNAT family N-acetyltransferase, partial [Chloroflexota bacterium]|nr:GNAT family N-acetyltransferase [Chloroflexota bacterium]
ARARGFRPFRAQHVMLRPADAPPPPIPRVAGARIRPLREGEEPALLAALNRAWAETWNFRPLAGAALAADLAGQRAGFLVAEATAGDARIVGTVHARFDPRERNPGGGPYAWISNLTTDPAWRGRGLGRALLAAGITYLRGRGAGSVALGVDGGAAVPVALYRSAGFETIGMVEIWEAPLARAPRRTSAADTVTIAAERSATARMGRARG